jgi:hypothetical protein
MMKTPRRPPRRTDLLPSIDFNAEKQTRSCVQQAREPAQQVQCAQHSRQGEACLPISGRIGDLFLPLLIPYRAP